jgi:bacterioferritin
MASEKLLEMLNKSRARELGVIIQYMRQHYVADGLESPAIMEMFKEIAVEEMKHAERFGERINYLGGVPTTKPDDILKSDDLKAMIADDLKSENEAIQLYREAIKLCIKEDDPVTRLMYEQILAEEEDHADKFETLLGIKK